jgi:hypothetical protein
LMMEMALITFLMMASWTMMLPLVLMILTFRLKFSSPPTTEYSLLVFTAI